MVKNKKGISLIAVLLFMLVATIAATATYKLLSSENRSSGSRMFQNEARMASLAGIESARSWFSHHGNETGAIIKQFLANKKSINLDDQLVTVKNNKQNYNVYITDVDVKQLPFKVQVTSVGTSINGTKYSETAVFKVHGLYRVPKPTIETKSDYDYAYFGGTTNFSGDHKATSMVINGNWSGNPGNVSKDFIVTGTVDLSGNNINVGGTACLGGAANFQNGFTTGNVFSDGNVSSLNGTISGNAYFNKNVSFGSAGQGSSFLIGGSLTLNGTMDAEGKEFDISVGKNFCTGNTSAAKLKFRSQNQHKFSVEQDVWVPYRTTLNGSRNLGDYNKMILGKKADSKLYIHKMKVRGDDNVTGYDITGSDNNLDLKRPGDYGKDFSSYPSDFYYQKGDEGDFSEYIQGSEKKWAYVKNYGQFTTKSEHIVKEISDPSNQLVTCAEETKDYCDKIWEKKAGCDNSQYYVPDKLTTSYEKFKTFAAKSSCSKDIKVISEETITKMNECYNTLSADPTKKNTELFNGFLVLNLNHDFNAANGVQNSILDGKFIFIYENQLGQFALPQTTSTSSVFLYLKEGASSTIDCKCPSSKNCKTEAYHNYFIFANKSLNGFLGSCKYSGSTYAVSANCAGLGNVGGSVDMEYNSAVVSSIAQSGIVCNAGTTCNGSVSTSTGSSDPSASGSDGYDSDFIAVASKIAVELESQYRTTKSIDVSNAENVTPSIIVLPRVVYINDNASGKLSDYLTVKPLNGIQSLSSGQIECPDYTALTRTPLVSGNEKLNGPAPYNCTYTASANNQSYESNFYVYVGGSSSAVPNVKFDGNTENPLSPTEETTTDVFLEVQGVPEGTGPFSIDIVLSGNIDWDITSHIGDAIESSSREKRYRYTGQKSSTTTMVKIFTLTTNSSSSKGNLWMTLDNPQQCVPTRPIQLYSIRGEATVARGSIEDFCTNYTNDDYCKNKDYCQGKENCTSIGNFNDIPSCNEMITANFGDNYEWITTTGDDCEVYESDPNNTNNKWKCYTGSAINLVKKNSSSLREYCDFYVPGGSNNEITTFSNGTTSKLYAEIKRKRKTLTVKLLEKGNGSATVYFSNTAYGSQYDLDQAISNDELSSYTCNSEECTYDIYTGYHIYLKGNTTSDSKFSYWRRYSAGTPKVLVMEKDNPFHIFVDKDTMAIGFFNQRDEHCFFDEIQNVVSFCDDNSCPSSAKTCNCIDKCTSGTHCSLGTGHMYAKANWVLVYSNGKDCTKYGTYCSGKDTWEPIEYYLGSIGSKDGLVSPNPKEFEGNGTESVLLSYANTGVDGSFTTVFRTGNIKKDNQTHYLNSGFIFRSDEYANKYLTLNVYGRNRLGGDKIEAALHTWARVCLNEGKSKTNNKNCVEKEIKTKSGGSIPLAWGSLLTLEALLEGESLTLNFSYNLSLANSTADIATPIVFNLTEGGLEPLNDETHQYLGLKLADPDFSVMNAAWRSDDKECWDTPYTTCSFASNYPNGRVPPQKDAMPWVGISTWFADRSCTVKYYYNGCDMNDDKDRYETGFSSWINSVASGVLGASCNDISSDGYYWGTSDGGKNGAALKASEKYNFLYEGLHGEVKSTPHSGIARNASVLVSCSGLARNYVANCGTFWVGTIKECSKNETLLPQLATIGINEIEVYESNASTPYGFEFLDNEGNPKSVNLRSAILDFTMDEQSSEVTLYLKDNNGRDSKTAIITPENSSVDISTLIDEFGFDPENVNGIIFVSTGYYKISSIRSECSNAPTASCSDASFDPETNKLTLYGSATNGDRCEIQYCEGGVACKKTVPCTSSPFVAVDVKNITQGEEYTVKLNVTAGSETVTCDNPITKVLYEGTSGGDDPQTTTKSATCTIVSNTNGSKTYSIGNVTGCDNSDCSISVKKGDATTNYGTTSLNNDGASQAIEDDGTYYVYFNEATTPMTGDCNGFTVKMETNQCKCTCSSGCNNLKNGTFSGTNYAVQCFFASSISELNGNYSMNEYKVNGHEIGYCGEYLPLCPDALKDIPTINGGYYIEVPVSWKCWNNNRNESCEWIKIVVGGNSVPDCSIGTVSGSGDSGNGSGSGDSGSNSGSNESGNTNSYIFDKYGDEGAHTFEAGKSYSISCPLLNHYYHSICCWSADGSSGNTFTINGEVKTLNPGNWGQSGACTDGSATITTPSSVDVKCSYCN